MPLSWSNLSDPVRCQMLMEQIDRNDVHAPPRARGAAALTARRRGDRSEIATLRMEGSQKLLFPRQHGRHLTAVTLNTAGGVTGGDRFALTVEAQTGSHLTLTTQAAERIYRAAPGVPGRVSTRLTAEAAAVLHWLPQETILFDGAALDRRLEVHLAPTARFVSVETLVFGRAAMGEVVRDLHLRDRLDLFVGGSLQFADRLRLEGDAQATLDRAFVAQTGRAVASVICAGPDAAAAVPDLRAALGDQAGVSALTDDLVFLRLVAPDSFDLRRGLVPLLTRLTGTELPRTWMI